MEGLGWSSRYFFNSIAMELGMHGGGFHELARVYTTRLCFRSHG